LVDTIVSRRFRSAKVERLDAHPTVSGQPSHIDRPNCDA
jgi:hypothetical protein